MFLFPLSPPFTLYRESLMNYFQHLISVLQFFSLFAIEGKRFVVIGATK